MENSEIEMVNLEFSIYLHHIRFVLIIVVLFIFMIWWKKGKILNHLM